MSRAITITDTSVLNTLTRALVAAKFQLEPIDPDVPGSAIISELANQVADLCGDLLIEQGRLSRDQTTRWRDPYENPHVLKCVQARVRECDPWPGLERLEKEQFIAALLAPYLPEPEFVEPCAIMATLITPPPNKRS